MNKSFQKCELPISFRQIVAMCIVTLFFALGASCLNQDSDKSGTATADEEVKTFLSKGAQPISVADGSWIDSHINDQRVVLIGEEVHGIAEHIHLKSELARRLITHHGFTHIFLEDDVFKAKYIHNNIHATSPQPSASVFRFFFWCWNVTELHDFFDHLPALQPLPAVHGLDVQTAAFAIHSLKSNSKKDEQLAAIQSLDEIFAGGRSTYAKRSPETQINDLAFIEKLTDVFPQTDIEHVQRHLRRVQAVWTVADDLDLRMNARDRGMAESVMDVLKSDHNAKVIIFAHNTHAGYSPFYENHSQAGIIPLGKHLRDTAGVKTLSIGAVAATGSILLDPRAREDNGGPIKHHRLPKPGTQAEYWFAIPHDRWLLDVNAVTKHDMPNAVAAFFTASPAGYFDNYGPARPLGNSYDLIVGYREVNPATPPQ